MKQQIILIAGLLALMQTAVAQGEHKKVLFIGNSYTQVNNLPDMVKSVALSAGDEVEYSAVLAGGASFATHCTSTGAMNSLRSGGWDIVVLQGQSQEPSFPWSQFSAETKPYAQKLADTAYAYSNCPEVMFYMTWGRKDGDQGNAASFDSLATYEGMDNLLHDRYMYMGRTNDASVSPVGRVWRVLRTEHPELELYQSDGSHPSLIGSYAAACTFYTMMFHRSPLLITDNLSVADETAQTIRQTVQRVVFDSLGRYSYPAVISAAMTTDSLHWHFECSSIVEPTSCEWDFGDGSVGDGPTADHTYISGGTYTVTATVQRRCNQSPATVIIDIPDNGDTPTEGVIPVSAPTIKLYPTPASDHLNIELSQPVSIEIIDMSGKVVVRQTVQSHARIDLSRLPAGTYLVRGCGSLLARFEKL